MVESEGRQFVAHTILDFNLRIYLEELNTRISFPLFSCCPKYFCYIYVSIARFLPQSQSTHHLCSLIQIFIKPGLIDELLRKSLLSNCYENLFSCCALRNEQAEHLCLSI
jgi:hypothetical protein